MLDTITVKCVVNISQYFKLFKDFQSEFKERGVFGSKSNTLSYCQL